MSAINLQLDPSVLGPLIRQIVAETVAQLEADRSNSATSSPYSAKPRPPAFLACVNTSSRRPPGRQDRLLADHRPPHSVHARRPPSVSGREPLGVRAIAKYSAFTLHHLMGL